MLWDYTWPKAKTLRTVPQIQANGDSPESWEK